MAQTGAGPKYPNRAALELVTWAERDDPHWFGARIPDAPISIETLQVGSDGHGSVYQRFDGGFDGAGLPEHEGPSQLAAQRTAFLLSLTPAQLP
jgi:hypothetical protein